MFWYGNEFGGWGYALMTISIVLFWGLVIFGIVAVMRSSARGGQRSTPVAAPRQTPEEVLDERFALGQINEQELRQRRDALHDKTRPLIKN